MPTNTTQPIDAAPEREGHSVSLFYPAEVRRLGGWIMSAMKLNALMAQIPQSIREQTALERQVFDNEKSAESAARAHFRRFPINEHGLRLTSHLVRQLHKKTCFFTRGGKLIHGLAVVQEGAQ